MKKLIIFSAIAFVLCFIGCKKDEELKYNIYTNQNSNDTIVPIDTLPIDTLPIDTVPVVVNCDTTNVSYSNHIAIIFAQNCANCHNPTYVDPDDDDDDDDDDDKHGKLSDDDEGLEPYLTTYNEIRKAIQHDPAEFFEMIHHTGGEDPMPPTYKLTDCQIRQIEIWYQNGMPNN